MGHTAPAQAGSLLLLGPFLDFWLTNKRVDAFDYSAVAVVSTEMCLNPLYFSYDVMLSCFKFKRVDLLILYKSFC